MDNSFHSPADTVPEKLGDQLSNVRLRKLDYLIQIYLEKQNNNNRKIKKTCSAFVRLFYISIQRRFDILLKYIKKVIALILLTLVSSSALIAALHEVVFVGTWMPF